MPSGKRTSMLNLSKKITRVQWLEIQFLGLKWDTFPSESVLKRVSPVHSSMQTSFLKTLLYHLRWNCNLLLHLKLTTEIIWRSLRLCWDIRIKWRSVRTFSDRPVFYLSRNCVFLYCFKVVCTTLREHFICLVIADYANFWKFFLPKLLLAFWTYVYTRSMSMNDKTTQKSLVFTWKQSKWSISPK